MIIFLRCSCKRKLYRQRTHQCLPGVGGGRRGWLQRAQGNIFEVIEIIYHDFDGGWEPTAINL